MKKSGVSRRKRAGSVLALLLVLLVFVACPPSVTNFTPERGREGTEVTIHGKNFESLPANNAVEFGGVRATAVRVESSEKIIATVPAGAQTGLITVATSDGQATSAGNFIVVGGAQWTFMVYLDADNNLESAGITDFAEMASVGSTDGVNIVVQMDRVAGHTTSHGNWTDTRRFLIQRGDTPSDPPVQNLGEVNMGDPNSLEDFVQWSVTNYPAEHYALVIWNHGDGWRLDREAMAERISMMRSAGDAERGVSKAVASDDTDGDELYMREVQDALQAAKAGLEERLGTLVKLDVVGFDACLMGMVEVAYAMRSVADYMVGSEELEPGNGWPYDDILEELVAVPSFSPRDLASVIVTEYGNEYGSGVTQSAVDISKVQNLSQRINDFTSAANAEWAELKTARTNCRQYHPSWSTSCWGVDLRDFTNLVYSGVTTQPIKDAATQLKTAIDDFVVNEHHSSDMSGSNGIAIYFPPTSTDFNNDPQHAGYTQANTVMVVDFVKYNKWDEWLQDYYTNIP